MIKKLVLSLLMVLASIDIACAEVYRPAERWRGFNLQGMFYRGSRLSSGSFAERDFREISELGFNFVRLPLDYRFWIKNDDWNSIDESALKPLDDAIAYGRRYQIHVMLNLHRAPGYTVAKPPEALNLFQDAEALRVCRRHWKMLARRYREVPAENLSFNLFNEPQTTVADYERVVALLVADIRACNAQRLIVCDGLGWGRTIVPELFKYGVGQACRGYTPMTISHYRAAWAGNSTIPPQWPPVGAVTPLYGPLKQQHAKPLWIEGVPACNMIIKPGRVSGNVTITIDSGKQKLATIRLEPGETDGWSSVEYKEQWKIYQAECDRTFEVAIPGNSGRISIAISAGDWAEIEYLKVRDGDGHEAELHFTYAWYKQNPVIHFKGFGKGNSFVAADAGSSVDWLRANVTAPWVQAAQSGRFVFVGEFGSYKHTPHSIVLAWMEDYLEVWQSAGIGWALWNYKGSFGIIDSERLDVEYEDFHGRKLDRAMLDLLQRY